MVVDIGSIERGCHLVPCFSGFDTEIVGSKRFIPSLDVYKDFWINNWIDGHMYNTIYAYNWKWR
jgi:hypothetical protein